MKRGAKAMANHWGLIQTACNKWHGIVEEVAARPDSGTSVEDQVSHTVAFRHACTLSPRARRARRLMFFRLAHLLRMFAMFRDDNSDAEFKYLHVFRQIDKCEKWAVVRRTLTKAKDTYKPDAPTAGAADGRPDGNKGAKKAK